MNVGAFWTELAISLCSVNKLAFTQVECGTIAQVARLKAIMYLGKVFADCIGRRTEVVTEWARVACLTCTLTKELARYVRSICIDEH